MLLSPRAGSFALSSLRRRTLLSHSFSTSFTPLRPFKLADIGEGITECEIVKWLIEPGVTIVEFDPIVEVMSDKATVEITSPFSGKVTALFGKVGEIVKVGEVLCEIDDDTSTTATATTATATTATATSAPPPPSPHAAAVESSSHTATSIHPAPTPLRTGKDTLATPATRHLARLHNTDLSTISGTGKDGRVTKGDVLAHVNGTSAPEAPTLSSSPTPPPARVSPPAPLPSSPSTLSSIPLTGARLAMFRSLTFSLQIPHFTYGTTIDVTDLTRLQQTLSTHVPSRWSTQSEPSQQLKKITLLPLLLKSLSLALLDNPLFLSTLSTTDKPALTPRDSHDISLALSTNDGLYTPLLPSVEKKSVYELASEIRSLTSVAPAFLSQNRGAGTITFSNLGSLPNCTARTLGPILPPTGALGIIAAGRTRVEMRIKDEKDAWKLALSGEEGKVELRPRLVLDITAAGDHRAVEGVELAKLVEDFRLIVENPGRLAGGH